MSRTYEFLEDRMSYLNKDTFNKYYGMRMYYQFMPKVGDIPTLKKYVFKEENDLVRGILNRPVVTVEVKNAEEADKFLMEWSIGFEGVELKQEGFAIEEELYSLEEIENVAMWMTHMNILELDWKQAVDKLHKIYKKQSK
ncbi:MAG: hypothetical protein MR549_00435 [Lachnobacterium sp.]|mgnify:FL=1|nr:hypothetical protein [Lachnobacterium sp.]